MADKEIVQIIRIDTGAAVQNIKDLKENIKALKEGWKDAAGNFHEGLNTMEIGTEEYKSQLQKLTESQTALRNSMYATSSSMEDVAKAAQGMGQSYNALVAQMAKYKAELRAVDVSTDEGKQKFAELAQKINGINNQLKAMDAAQGNYSRNVGNYGNALGQAFTNLGGVIGGPFARAVQTGDKALKVMSANPVMGVLTLLLPIINSLISSLKSSEENMNAVNKAMAAFKPIGDAVTKIIQAVGGAVAALVTGLSDLVTSIFGVSDAMKARQEIAEQEIELTQRQREATVLNAEAERDAAQAREKAYDKENYTAKERLEFLKEAGEKEAEIAQRAYEDAKIAYELQKAKNALTQTSAEEKQREADAYAALVKAETAYLQKLTANHKEINKVNKEIAREGRDAAKAAADAARARLQAQKDLIDQTAALEMAGSEERLRLEKESARKSYEIAVADAKSKIADKTALAQTLANLEKKYQKDVEKLERDHQKNIEAIRVQGMKNLAEKFESGTVEYLEAMKAVRKQELDDIQQEEGEATESFIARQIAAQKAYNDAVKALNERRVKESTEALQLAYAQSARTTEETLAYEMQMAEANVAAIEKLGRQAGETEAEFLTRLADAKKEAMDATTAYLDYQDEQTRLHYENEMNALTEGSDAYLVKALELKKYELDSIHKLEEESEEEFRARQLEAERAYNDARKNLVKARIDMTMQAVSAVSDILGSLADIYESNTDQDRKAAKKAKNLRIAGATIDMLQGAVTAFATAQSLGPIAGPFHGGINAAAVLAAGTANIAKIKATDVDSGTTTTGTVPQTTSATVTPAVSDYTPPEQVRTITSASEEDRLNRMAEDQRVYILQSDIEAAGRTSKVQVDEATF